MFIQNPNAAAATVSLLMHSFTCNYSGQITSIDVDLPVSERKAYQLRLTRPRFGGPAGVIVDVQQ